MQRNATCKSMQWAHWNTPMHISSLLYEQLTLGLLSQADNPPTIFFLSFIIWQKQISEIINTVFVIPEITTNKLRFFNRRTTQKICTQHKTISNALIGLCIFISILSIFFICSFAVTAFADNRQKQTTHKIPEIIPIWIPPFRINCTWMNCYVL